MSGNSTITYVVTLGHEEPEEMMGECFHPTSAVVEHKDGYQCVPCGEIFADAAAHDAAVTALYRTAMAHAEDSANAFREACNVLVNQGYSVSLERE